MKNLLLDLLLILTIGGIILLMVLAFIFLPAFNTLII
jgi:hypothetical protein